MRFVSFALCLAGAVNAAATGGGNQGVSTSLCRVYPTSFVDTLTTSGTVSLIVTGKQSYDLAHHQLIADTDHGYATGLKYRQHQVWDYATDGEFIAEVLRVTGPVIPPVSLFRETRITGQFQYTTRQTFGAPRQVQRTDGASQAGTVTAIFTAWDKLGRPTAGSMRSSAPASTMFTTIYDDLARTATTVTKTDSAVNRIVQTFDDHGNLIREESVTTPGGTTSRRIQIQATAEVCGK